MPTSTRGRRRAGPHSCAPATAEISIAPAYPSMPGLIQISRTTRDTPRTGGLPGKKRSCYSFSGTDALRCCNGCTNGRTSTVVGLARRRDRRTDTTLTNPNDSSAHRHVRMLHRPRGVCDNRRGPLTERAGSNPGCTRPREAPGEPPDDTRNTRSPACKGFIWRRPVSCRGHAGQSVGQRSSQLHVALVMVRTGTNKPTDTVYPNCTDLPPNPRSPGDPQ